MPGPLPRELLAEHVPDLAVGAQVLVGLAQADDVARPGQLHVVDHLDPAGSSRHDDDPIGQRDRFREVVGDEDDGLAPLAPQRQQFAVQIELGVEIQGAEGLVHQEDLGLEDQGPHERHALPHSTRQRGREGVLETLEAGHAHGGRYPPLLRVAPDAAVLEAQRDVPPHGPPREHRVLLEHVPHVGGHTTARPSISMTPAEGSTRPAIMLRIVDLPQPDGPTIATNSSSPISNETSLTASTVRAASRKVFARSRTTMRGRRLRT